MGLNDWIGLDWIDDWIGWIGLDWIGEYREAHEQYRHHLLRCLLSLTHTLSTHTLSTLSTLSTHTHTH